MSILFLHSFLAIIALGFKVFYPLSGIFIINQIFKLFSRILIGYLCRLIQIIRAPQLQPIFLHELEFKKIKSLVLKSNNKKETSNECYINKLELTFKQIKLKQTWLFKFFFSYNTVFQEIC